MTFGGFLKDYVFRETPLQKQEGDSLIQRKSESKHSVWRGNILRGKGRHSREGAVSVRRQAGRRGDREALQEGSAGGGNWGPKIVRREGIVGSGGREISTSMIAIEITPEKGGKTPDDCEKEECSLEEEKGRPIRRTE